VIGEVTDSELARRVASGDRAAENDLCRRLGPRIRLYGLRHLRSAAAADDLVQQVLLTTIEALRADRLRDGEKLVPFVLGTCRLTVIGIRRGDRRRQLLLEEFGDVLVPVPRATTPFDRDRLTGCVQALKERERAVVVMTFYDERTAPESASFLGLSEANLRVIRHRAIKQLRACMEARS
jgi:RNA polymerase sigma-70 factor (ECF subfamily)